MISKRQNKKKFNNTTKHLSIIVGMAIILFVVIVVYIRSIEDGGLEEYAKSQAALSLEEQAQLSDIAEYLNSIDEIVMTNQE